MQTLRLDPAMFTRDTLDLFNFQILMTQVTSYLFVTVMILQMIVEIIPILGYEVTPKHTGHLKKNYCCKTIRTTHFKCASADMNLM